MVNIGQSTGTMEEILQRVAERGGVLLREGADARRNRIEGREEDETHEVSSLRAAETGWTTSSHHSFLSHMKSSRSTLRGESGDGKAVTGEGLGAAEECQDLVRPLRELRLSSVKREVSAEASSSSSPSTLSPFAEPYSSSSSSSASSRAAIKRRQTIERRYNSSPLTQCTDSIPDNCTNKNDTHDCTVGGGTSGSRRRHDGSDRCSSSSRKSKSKSVSTSSSCSDDDKERKSERKAQPRQLHHLGDGVTSLCDTLQFIKVKRMPPPAIIRHRDVGNRGERGSEGGRGAETEVRWRKRPVNDGGSGSGLNPGRLYPTGVESVDHPEQGDASNTSSNHLTSNSSLSSHPFSSLSAREDRRRWGGGAPNNPPPWRSSAAAAVARAPRSPRMPLFETRRPENNYAGHLDHYGQHLDRPYDVLPPTAHPHYHPPSAQVPTPPAFIPPHFRPHHEGPFPSSFSSSSYPASTSTSTMSYPLPAPNYDAFYRKQKEAAREEALSRQGGRVMERGEALNLAGSTMHHTTTRMYDRPPHLSFKSAAAAPFRRGDRGTQPQQYDHQPRFHPHPHPPHPHLHFDADYSENDYRSAFPPPALTHRPGGQEYPYEQSQSPNPLDQSTPTIDDSLRSDIPLLKRGILNRTL